MKLREKLKRFWTLDVHNHEGFTLVELIIVIAILAILSTGAIAGYSAYIKQANMTADEALIAEIKNVLTLAYYSGAIGENEEGRIILSTNGASVSPDSSKLIAVLEEAYGENWEDALTLNYTNWDLSTAASSTSMGYIEGSNFDTDEMKNLLSSVQHISNQFTGYIEGGNFTPSTELKAYLDKMGIDSTDPQAMSNATVLFVGSLFADTKASDQDIANAWVYEEYDGITGGDDLSTNAAQFAATLALATYVEREANLTDKPYTTQLNSATGKAVISTMETVKNQIMANHEDLAMKYYGFDKSDENDISTDAPAYKDAMAFQAYMTGMTSASSSLLQSTDISSNNFYADGNVLSYVENYIQLSEDLGLAGIKYGVAIFIFNGVVSHIGTAK